MLARQRRLGRLGGAWLAAAVLLAGCRPAAPPGLLIDNVTVVDARPSTPLAGRAVLVAGERIERVAAAGSLRPGRGTRVVDGTGLYLVPGLWDMHTHALWEPFFSGGYLALFVAHGVTGIRDMGGTLEVLQRLRDPRRRPGVEPRVVAAGPGLDGVASDPRALVTVSSAEEARARVAENAAAGADFVKVYLQLPEEVYRAILDEAARHGLPVAGHVPLSVDAATAAEDGFLSIEHMQAEIGGYCDPAPQGDCPALFELFRRLGTWQVPTLAVRRSRAYLDDPRVFEAAALAQAPPYLLAEWGSVRAERLAEMDAAALDAVRGRWYAERRLAAALVAAEVPVLAGSDAGELYSLAGAGLHDELDLLVEAGMTPRQALSAATLGPAEYLGETDTLGTVEPGRRADLVLLEADPLESIANLRRIHAVVLGGRLLDRAELDTLVSSLPAVRRAAAGSDG